MVKVPKSSHRQPQALSTGAIFWSTQLGILLNCEDQSIASVLYASGNPQWSERETQFRLSYATDWQTLSGPISDELLRELTLRHDTERHATLLVSLLSGLSEELTSRSLHYLNDWLATNAHAYELLDRILIAPLHYPEQADRLAKLSEAAKLERVAEWANTLFQYQQPLRKLVNAWLGLKTRLFADADMERSYFWTEASRQGLIRKLLDSTCRASFETLWIKFALANSKTTEDVKNLGATLAVEFMEGITKGSTVLTSFKNHRESGASDTGIVSAKLDRAEAVAATASAIEQSEFPEPTAISDADLSNPGAIIAFEMDRANLKWASPPRHELMPFRFDEEFRVLNSEEVTGTFLEALGSVANCLSDPELVVGNESSRKSAIWNVCKRILQTKGSGLRSKATQKDLLAAAQKGESGIWLGKSLKKAARAKETQ